MRYVGVTRLYFLIFCAVEPSVHPDTLGLTLTAIPVKADELAAQQLGELAFLVPFLHVVAVHAHLVELFASEWPDGVSDIVVGEANPELGASVG